MKTIGPRGSRIHILLIIMLAMVAVAPAVGAQLGTGVRINAGNDTSAQVGLTDAGVTADVDAEIDATDATDALADADPTGTVPARVRADTGDGSSQPAILRLYTRVDERMVDRLVTSALEVPEVRDMLDPKSRLDVTVDGTHFLVDVAGGAVQGVTAVERAPSPDYTIHAGTDAARSLANAADAGYTAVQLLKGHYITIEAERFTHQAALKAFFSGFLDDQLDVPDRLQDVEFEGDATAAEQAILASGLRIVRVNGQLYAANQLGGLVAALHDGTRALGDPPESLGIKLSGVPGGASMDRARLGGLLDDDSEIDALRQAMRDTAARDGQTPGLDAARAAKLLDNGAPHPFLMGLGANQLAHAHLLGDTA